MSKAVAKSWLAGVWRVLLNDDSWQKDAVSRMVERLVYNGTAVEVAPLLARDLLRDIAREG